MKEVQIRIHTNKIINITNIPEPNLRLTKIHNLQ